MLSRISVYGLLRSLTIIAFSLPRIQCLAPAPGPALTNVSNSQIDSTSNCFTGIAHVHVNATTTKFSVPQELSSGAVVDLVQQLSYPNSSFISSHEQGHARIEQNFSIAATLCTPGSSIPNKGVVQVLTPGVGLGKDYWNTSLPNNSYVAAMNAAGYSTVAYDRLGSGQSQKPDPVNIVQANTHVELLHGLVRLLRSGLLISSPHTKIVGVGHSYGSIIQLGAAAKYPGDFDAVLITGLSDTLASLGQTSFATTPAPAKDDPSGAYVGLPGSYLIDPAQIGVQLAFFKYPYYQQSVLSLAYAKRATYRVGDLLTVNDIYAPAPSYTGPVYVADGAEDMACCSGNCSVPYDRADKFRKEYFPDADASKSRTDLLPNTGHLINQHITAPFAFQRAISFLNGVF